MSTSDPSIIRPADAEYPAFYGGYVRSVPDGRLTEFLRASGSELATALSTVTEERASYSYQPGKWSIRTLVGHMCDAERIFAYRALRVARGDQTPLPGFDENIYAVAAESDTRQFSVIAAELRAVREATITLFESIPADAWGRSGIVNDNPMTFRALAWITAGHAKHHLNILRERYGVS